MRIEHTCVLNSLKRRYYVVYTVIPLTALPPLYVALKHIKR